MKDWKNVLKADPTDWLLETDNPSVQYFTLTEILERPESDQEVRNAREEIMDTGVVPRFWPSRRMKVTGNLLRISTLDPNTREPCGNS